MRRLSTLFALLLVCVASVVLPAGRWARLDAAGPVTVSILESGLTVATREQPADRPATVAVTVRAGGRDDPPELQGLAHYLEHAHFLGAGRFQNSDEIFGVIAATGGEMNATTSTETTTYYATVPAAQVTAALDLFAQMMVRPRFPDEELLRERSIVQDELRAQPRRPNGARELLRDRLMGQVTADAGGTVATVGAITPAALNSYRATRYVAANTTVAVIGPWTHARSVAAVRTLFAEMPSGPRPAAVLPPPPAPFRVDDPALDGFDVVIGTRIPGMDSPDAAALAVLDGILDGPGTRVEDAFAAFEGTTGGTRIQQVSDSGLWLAFASQSLSGQIADKEQLLDVLRAEIRRLHDQPVPPVELAAVTRFIAGRLFVSLQTGRDQALRLSRLAALGVYTTEDEWARLIRAVTPEDIQRVARLYLSPDQMSIVASY